MGIGIMALGAVAALLAAAPPAGAPPAGDGDELNLGRMTRGYTYYNRPHADVASHDADVKACLLAISDGRSTEAGMAGSGLLESLLDSARNDSVSRGVMSAGIENCMVVRGWRVVRLDDVEGAALAALPSAELAAALAGWIGAEMPHGQVVRIWHNDAALASVNHFSLHAQHNRNGQLSVLAVGSTISATFKADRAADRATPKPVRIKLDPKWPKNALKPDTLDTAPAGAALIIVNIKGMSLRQGNGFSFNRIGADPSGWPSTLDHAPDLFSAFVGTLAASPGGKFLAFAVPPGRWRIYSMNGGAALNFCLGSPAFDVGTDEVVYVGQLDLKQERLLPGQDLAPVRTWMGPAKAAERLRPATFTNGSQSQCAPTNSIYALEFEGAPFEKGYAFGSKAWAEQTAPGSTGAATSIP